jgi:hypothetical protein
MENLIQPAAPVKSALFVDFDNIYIGLTKTDPIAAERFASDPFRWLAWLEKGLPGRNGGHTRSILIRRCYPNPDAGFRRYRSFFTSAAFAVIDCPSLTRTGKNSADIYMVMDILDMLNHKTHFDEFIIFSGDSDFLPVLLRLRAYDRRTTTLAIDFMPPAFKAACDLVISEEEFIEEALGVTSDANGSEGAAGRSRVPMGLLRDMSARVYSMVSDTGEVAGANLPDLLKDFREFRDSNNWLGFGTSQRLAEALVSCEPRLSLVRVNPMMYKLVLKPQIVAPVPPPAEHPSLKPRKPIHTPDILPQSAVVKDESQDTDGERAARPIVKLGKSGLARLRNQITELVKDLVSGSSSPVLLARASQYVVNKLGPQVLDTQWAGTGSFKRLLQTSSGLGLEITTQPEPGYVFDPQRHTHPAQAGAEPSLEEKPATQQEQAAAPQAASEAEPLVLEEAFELDNLPDRFEEEPEEPEEEYEESLPSLEEFIRRVSRVTGAPDLTPEDYALVFHGIVNELHEIAAGRKTYNTYQSSKEVSAWCSERGRDVARADLVLIFKGIIFQDGVRFSRRPGSYTAKDVAQVVRSNIKALCQRSRLELSDYEERLLDEWIFGELEEEEARYAGQKALGEFAQTLDDSQAPS